MMKDVLKSIIYEFHTRKLPELIRRNLKLPLESGKIISVVGPRRAGKTYLLFQHIEELLEKGVDPRRVLYLNFEDERMDLEVHTLDLILQAYRELYPELDLAGCYFFLDEVQNIAGWERFVRRLYDTVSRNVFITGSNSKLLSQEIATALRGRTITYELLPLSFREFLRFKGFDFDPERDFYSPSKRARVTQLFQEYLDFGGFPEIAFLQEELKIRTLQEYFEVMLYRDIAERYQVRDTLVLKYFLKRVMENSGKFLSVHKIYNELKSQGIKVGKDSLYSYLEFAENAYLVRLLRKHHRSFVKSELAEKKVYAIDTGLLKGVRFLRESAGVLLENAVFLELLRKSRELVCFKGQRECDFILDGKVAIQVCFSLRDEEVVKRELSGLKEACSTLGLKEGYVVSFDEQKDLKIDGDITVKVVPACEFILRELR
ncbi:MAG: ATP-binding protein [Candidatus Caldatribacterium sp.]|nr:ATP-binding protein [Candidatus Caldatribacterium sp.]